MARHCRVLGPILCAGALACAGPPDVDDGPVPGTAVQPTPIDEPGLAVSPELAAFATTAVGQRCPIPATLTVMHISGPVATPEVRLDSDSFRITRNDCQDLQPGRRCTLDVAFAPTAPGARMATLQVVMPSGTASVSLVGQGQATLLHPTRPHEFHFLGE